MKNAELDLDKILIGATKALLNSSQLLAESEILYNHKCYPRSYTLAHLASEELAKAMMLYNYVVRHLCDRKKSMNKFRRQFRDHLSKLDVLLLFDDFATEKPDGSPEDQKWREVLINRDHWNQLKNQSLYVDYDAKGDFVAPSDSFKKEVAESYLNLAKRRLEFFEGLAAHTRKFIKKLKADPELCLREARRVDAWTETAVAIILNENSKKSEDS